VFDLDSASAFFKIVLIDLVLSGDNAVVIGIAAARLSPEQRRKAIILGGGVAVGLRIIFTVLASLLLDIPLIQLVGGLLLFYIAYKLLQPADEGDHITAADNMAQAIKTILLADVVMSLDNVIAIAVASRGSYALLMFGLAVSIPLIMAGAALVMSLLEKYPVVVWAGAALLGWIAGEIIAKDPPVSAHLNPETAHTVWMAAAACGALLVVGVGLLRRRMGRRASDQI